MYNVATILVLYNAGPLDVSWAVSSAKVAAIIESFFPAQVNMHSKLHIIRHYAVHVNLVDYSDWW